LFTSIDKGKVIIKGGQHQEVPRLPDKIDIFQWLGKKRCVKEIVEETGEETMQTDRYNREKKMGDRIRP
jgi:hypothetical protein